MMKRMRSVADLCAHAGIFVRVILHAHSRPLSDLCHRRLEILEYEDRNPQVTLIFAVDYCYTSYPRRAVFRIWGPLDRLDQSGPLSTVGEC